MDLPGETSEKSEITFAVLTVSDRCSRNESTDFSGPHLQKLIAEKFGSAAIYDLVADEKEQIKAKLLCFTDGLLVDVVFTTGGTGFAPRDVTPEATKMVIEKEAPQLALLMGLKSLEKTKFAVLSRAVCGIRGKSLIVNFPGSKKAVDECFLAIADVIKHAVEIITEQTKCIREVHREIQGERVVPDHVCPHQTGTGDNDRMSPFPMLEVDEALEIIFLVCSKFRSKPVELSSFINLPPFRASVKDGYAVKSAGGAGVKKVVGFINAGDETVKDDFGVDESYKINTGASIPLHCDAIIQIEDTELVLSSPDGTEMEVKLLRAPQLNEDIRQIGSDIKFGELLFENQAPLGAAEAALAAACGQNLSNGKEINVAIISTGDELVPPGSNLLDGQIFDSNTVMLKKLLKQFGFNHIETLLAKDSHSNLKEMMQYALQKNQFVICTGGVSMGDKDFVKPVLKDLGFTICFGRVNMKPGKPLTFGHKITENRIFFGLPGNPVSAFVTFHMFVLPAMRYSLNWKDAKCKLPVVQVELVNDSLRLDPRPEYVRATVSSVKGKLCASVTGNQVSSRLKSLINADVLLHMPGRTKERDTVLKGTILPATILKHDFISEFK